MTFRFEKNNEELQKGGILDLINTEKGWGVHNKGKLIGQVVESNFTQLGRERYKCIVHGIESVFATASVVRFPKYKERYDYELAMIKQMGNIFLQPRSYYWE